MIDFCQSYGAEPDAPETALVARIVVSPDGARELHQLLGKSLDEQGRLHAHGAQDRPR